jgi:hypothetical protein
LGPGRDRRSRLSAARRNNFPAAGLRR